MARHLRVEFPGAIYHVTCRMVGDWRTEKTLLFKDDADRERLLERLAERVEQYNIRLYLFVCMTNHFHLVCETPVANCSKFMQSLTTAYTVYYNLRHSRHGHVLDGRYKAKLVEGDDYLPAPIVLPGSWPCRPSTRPASRSSQPTSRRIARSRHPPLPAPIFGQVQRPCRRPCPKIGVP